MQVITIVQTKGGSGKTTTAMLLASAALDAGRRITLIDGDVNAQLGRWRDSFELAAWDSVKKPTWPEALSILSPPETVEGLLALLEEEEAIPGVKVQQFIAEFFGQCGIELLVGLGQEIVAEEEYGALFFNVV